MSVAATPAVLRAAAALPPGPALVFDLGVMRERMERARDAARTNGVELLYAVKSFPQPEAIELAAKHLDGLDVAGPEEQAAALELAPTNLSVTWPGDLYLPTLTALASRHRVTAVCESLAQLQGAASIPGVTLALRLSSDDESRFGIAPNALADMLRGLEAPVRERIRALHMHGGPLATSPATVGGRARRACDAAAAAGIALEQLDLGGSLHGFAIAHATSGQSLLADALAAARAAVPRSVRLLFEPGRLWTEGAGFAVGHVLAGRDPMAHVGTTADDVSHVGRANDSRSRTTRVLDLSRLCHLRWSTPRLVAPPPKPNEPRVAVTLLGATCCEDDVIGDALVPPEHLPSLAIGSRVILAGVTGYAAGWNRAFAGVPAARVLTVA
jgi:diaminopimelate decarboxylase